MSLSLIATCALGLEGVLVDELVELGATECKVEKGAVRFRGDHTIAYRCCYRSRVASRILLRLRRFPVRDARALYGGVNSIPWAEHIEPGRTLRVDFVGRSDEIRDHRFGAMKTKDGIVDRLRDDAGERPNIELKNPDVRVRVHLRGGHATVLLDLSGAPLFQRGWRVDGGPAPLKESLAAGLLRLAGWPRVAAEGGALVDPFCGSGTLLVEAAEMALGRAAGRDRRFGFERWAGHDHAAWSAVRSEADQPLHSSPKIYGSDRDTAQLNRSADHRDRLGLGEVIRLKQSDFRATMPPAGVRGLVVTNPPYGERLEELRDAERLMRELGDTLRHQWLGWTAWILAGSPKLAKRIGLRPNEKHEVFNGPLACRFFSVSIRDEAPEGPPAWRQKQ